MAIFIHSDFIKNPLTNVVEESIAVFDTANRNNGMEAYTISEYYLASVFLKITGASEQKMKCIVWDIASNDYRYRYNMLKKPYGECSEFTEKKGIAKDVLKQMDCDIDNILTDTTKAEILYGLSNSMKRIFEKSTLIKLYPRQWNEYCDEKIQNLFDKKDLKGSILSPECTRIYNDKIYKRRNELAHNSKSVLYNLPTLASLSKSESKEDNWFLFFHILLLMDEVIIKLYSEYEYVMKTKTELFN